MKLQFATAAIISISLLSGCQYFSGEGNDTTAAHTTPLNKHENDGVLRLTKSQLEKIGLTTYKVAYQNLPVELILEGEVKENDYQTTPVLSMVPGRVEDVDVQVGDRKSDSDNEVGTSKSKQNQNKCFASPAWKKAR